MLLTFAAACTLAVPIPDARCRCALHDGRLTTTEAMRTFTLPGRSAMVGRVIARRESATLYTRYGVDTLQYRIPAWVDVDLVVVASWDTTTADTVTVRSTGPWNNCHVELDVGESYLVLSDHHPRGGIASISTCLTPQRAPEAAARLALLDGAAPRRLHRRAPS